MNRIITIHEGEKGPLFVVTAAMHGNEHAGIKALRELDRILIHKKSTKPDFKLHGTLLGIIGNKQAAEQNVRYIESDLNRMWETEFVYEILENKDTEYTYEKKEMVEIIHTLRKFVMTGKYSTLYLLDLHTTSSDGIFSICTEDPLSVKIAGQLHAPVVRGLLHGLTGTTLHYFNHNNLGINATALAFEAGKHDDPLSVNRSVAAIINCMRSIGCLYPHEVENAYDELLISYSSKLPGSVTIKFKYHISENGPWEMLPGFKNFDPVYTGQHLANDNGKKICAPLDGLILMPLYQKKGQDGFFIVQA
jgi:succinylglutamate desuccinylase